MKHFLLKTVLLLCALVVGSNAWGDEATFAPSNFSGQGTSGTGSAISATVGGVTFACDKGYGTTQIRCYTGGKITISSSNTITAISFTFSGSYTGGMQTSYTGLSTNSWETTLSSQARITAITVTYSTSAPAFVITAQSNNVDYGTVSLSGNVITANPNSGYRVVAGNGGYTVTDGAATVTNNGNNTFSVNPTSNCTVQINFEAIPQYIVTTSDDINKGTLTVGNSNPSSTSAYAYEGETVSLFYTPKSGANYYLSSIRVTKTSDGTDTGITPAYDGSCYTFTMPGYAVTATAVYESTIYDGSFALYSGDLTEGDYILVYENKAVTSSVSSNKFGCQDVTPSNNVISDPSRSIVWHIAPSATDGYWTIYNAMGKMYANGSSSNTNVSLGDAPTANTAMWVVSGTYDFRCKANEGQSTVRYLRYNNTVFGNYASSNGGALTLYKYTVLTSRTITFNGNGGTYNAGTTYTQDVNDGVEATLNANQFTRSGYEFVGWNTEDNGSGATYEDEGAITVTGGDLTLYAQWAPLYTLTIDNSIDGGSVAVVGNVTSAIEGTEITLSYTPSAGHKFSAWNVYKAGDESTKVTVTDNNFNMPAYNVVISATFEEIQTYTLIKSVNDIVPGKHYIIASGTNGSVKAMGSQSTNYRSVVSVTANSEIIPETDGVYEFVIYGPNAEGFYTIHDAKYENNAGGYLYANSSSSNYMGTQASNDANGKWSIEIANTGAATINAQGTNSHSRMRFNGDRFSCYASNTSVSALPYLYVKDGDTPVPTTASVKLNAYGYATYASTSALDFLDADADEAEYSAWQITSISSEGNITFSQIKSTVASGNGILLKGTPNATINLNILPTGGATLSDNKLVGTTAPTAVNADEVYGLSGNKFVKSSAAGSIPAGKAYILASSIPSTVKSLNFVFEDETTGISEMKTGILDNEAWYDLQGRKVAQPTKGIYIHNGKKIFVK